MNFRIVTTLFLYASFSGYSQEYHPLLSNSGWCCETCDGTGCVYTEYPITGADYINDELYYIIDNSSFGNFYLQEDSISKRIWFLNDSEKELLYDFTLSESDTFQIEILDSMDATYIVEMVDTITTLSDNRKRWILNLMDTLIVGLDTVERSLTWIEGIGSTYGPVYQNNIPNWYHGTCLEGVYSLARVQIYQGYCNYIGGYWPDECKFISNDIEEYNVEPTIVFFND